MPVFYTGYNWLFYCKSSGSLDCQPCRMTAVRVVYITARFSTLLTGEFICNCLYLNWLSDQSLAKRYHWKVVLADSCCGLSLAMRSFSATYCKSVTNHACQEGRNSPPVHSLWLLKCPCYVSLWQNQGPKCQLGNDGWAPGPDCNYVILTKRGKKRPDFTPFVQIFQNGAKNDVFLHRFPMRGIWMGRIPAGGTTPRLSL